MSPISLPFQHAKIGQYFHPIPKLGNLYLGDAFLQRVLKRILPQNIFDDIHTDLSRLGQRVEEEVEPLGWECEIQEPSLQQFDPWGKRVDKLVTSQAWKRIKEITAEEGIISSGYDGKYAEFGRVYQFAKCMIFHPSSGLVSCPIAMTDGCAKTLKMLNIQKHEWIFDKLVSTSLKEFWTSGQWMTERQGGSDVAKGTETIAVKQDDGSYKLYGYKWFSSATDSDVALTLAKIQGQEEKGLSMFLLQTKKKDQEQLNGIQIMKLKNKLGTRSLPTAELLLDGAIADLVSEPGRGISAISGMLTITRLHNTVGSVGAMRRVLLLARDYSKQRRAFGKTIAEFPLHIDTLAEMEVQVRGGVLLLFEVVRLLGLSEHSKISEEDAHLLRLLTPVAKLFTAKKCMGVVSEGLEAFGGQGYIEDTGLPAILRNSQVMPIWEGTTNVLSLDTLRAIAKSQGAALSSLQSSVKQRILKVTNKDLKVLADRVEEELQDLVESLPLMGTEKAMSMARMISFSIAEIFIGSLFLEHASSENASPTDVTAALRWGKGMTRFKKQAEDEERFSPNNSSAMVFDGYKNYKAKL